MKDVHKMKDVKIFNINIKFKNENWDNRDTAGFCVIQQVHVSHKFQEFMYIVSS